MTESFPTPDGPLSTTSNGPADPSMSLADVVQLASQPSCQLVGRQKAGDDISRIHDEDRADFPMAANVNQLVVGLGLSDHALHRGGIRLKDAQHSLRRDEITASDRQDGVRPNM